MCDFILTLFPDGVSFVVVVFVNVTFLVHKKVIHFFEIEI